MKKVCTLSAALLFSSALVNAQWQLTANSPGIAAIQCLAINGTNIYAGSWGYGLFLSTTDSAGSWIVGNSPNNYVFSFAFSDTNIFAGTWNGVFLSSDNCSTWTKVSNGITNGYISTLTINGTNIFAGTEGGGVGGRIFLSTDNGNSWASVYNGIPNTRVHVLTLNGDDIFAGTDSGIFISTNNGNSWAAVNNGLPTTNPFKAIAAFGINIFAGSYGGGIFLSTDNGNSWAAVNNGLTNYIVNALAISGTNVFAGTNVGVFLSTDTGKTWTSVSNGLPNADILSFALNETHIFAGTEEGYGIWKRSLSDITSIEILSQELLNISIHPNPTSGKFTILYNNETMKQFSNLTIYNVLGEKIYSSTSTLTSTSVDLSTKPKGIYFIRVTNNERTITKKVVIE